MVSVRKAGSVSFPEMILAVWLYPVFLRFPVGAGLKHPLSGSGPELHLPGADLQGLPLSAPVLFPVDGVPPHFLPDAGLLPLVGAGLRFPVGAGLLSRLTCVLRSWSSAGGKPEQYFSFSALFLLPAYLLPALLPQEYSPFSRLFLTRQPHRQIKNSYGSSPLRSFSLTHPSVLYFPSPAL